jgi:ABC-type sugar transport system ATPase subunit
MSLLELRDVRKSFGAIEALRGVTLSASSATMAPASRR